MCYKLPELVHDLNTVHLVSCLCVNTGQVENNEFCRIITCHTNTRASESEESWRSGGSEDTLADWWSLTSCVSFHYNTYITWILNLPHLVFQKIQWKEVNGKNYNHKQPGMVFNLENNQETLLGASNLYSTRIISCAYRPTGLERQTCNKGGSANSTREICQTLSLLPTSPSRCPTECN